MAWKLLPTDYTDRVWSGLQRYIEVENEDGTVSFQDVTNYSSKEKSFFGAYDANRMNEALNILMSMVENGTNLYEDFLNYFETQKRVFENQATADLDDFNESLDDKLNTAQTGVNDFLAYMETKENDADVLMAAFRQYVNDFKSQYEHIIEEVESDYEEDIETYKQSQQAMFDMWFQYMKDQLSEDAAGHLQNEIDALKGALIMIRVGVQSYLIGKTVTCTNGTETKSIVIDNTLKCEFDFSDPGIYTLTDNFSGVSQQITAYHFGLYPVNINVAVITVNCPSYMVGKTVSLKYIVESEDRELSMVNNYVTSDDVTPTPPEGRYYEAIVDSEGKAVFAVTILGRWLVANNYTEETQIVEVVDFDEYSVNLHVATLTVNFSSEYEGNICTITSDSGTYSKAIPDSGVVTFPIPLFDDWVISNNRTFDKVTAHITDYIAYSTTIGIAKVRITFLSNMYIGETVTAKYETYKVEAVVPLDKVVELELKGLAAWKITNTRNDAVINVNATAYRTYTFELDDFVYVNGFVGQCINQ